MIQPLPFTDDAFLGGALQILQLRAAYRAGIDAVLLAAAAPLSNTRAGPGGARVLDAGAGVGVVGLSVVQRFPEASAVLVERQPELADLARQNAERNGLKARVEVVVADIEAVGGALGSKTTAPLLPSSFDHVLANPPYTQQGAGTPPASALKAAAHQISRHGWESWARFLTATATASGTVTLIHRADGLGLLLAALDTRFGDLKVLPLHPRQEEPAHRVIVQGRKGSRAPLRLLPGLVLHGADNGYTPQVTEILRHGAPLVL